MATIKLNHSYQAVKMADKVILAPSSPGACSVSQMMLLNETGHLLWNVLERGADEWRLQQALLEEYDVSPETALADVREFLNSLRHIGALA